MKTVITALVSKSHNVVWAGNGIVREFRLDDGVVILQMISGKMKGASGGFDIDKLKFQVTRT